MIKKLQKLFPSLIVSPNAIINLEKTHQWFITDDKQLIGIRKTELTDKDVSLISTFLRPYNIQFPIQTISEQKWQNIVESPDDNLHLEPKVSYRFIYFSMKPNQITPTQFKDAIQELFSREVPILWGNSYEGVIIEEKLTDDETISYDQIIDILMSDLYVTIKFLVGPYYSTFSNVKTHYDTLTGSAHAAFKFSKDAVITYIEAIPYFFISQAGDDLRSNISETILQEFIHDGETLKMIETFLACNLNISETAKELYMHRNSLQYRLDRFHEKTAIDVRKFHEAMAVYLALIAKL